MKKTILIITLAFIGLSTANAQVGIGTTSPDGSAILDVVSTEKGFLPPRMTITQRDAIQGATAGLVIYNNTSSTLEYSDGTNWIDLINKFTSPIIGTEPTTAVGGVGIGTDIPNVNAILDLDVSSLPTSGKKGFLAPRMSKTERDDIVNPAEGLLVYNTDDNCLNVFLGACWFSFCNNDIGPDDVLSTKTCKVWMNKNLGATQVATSKTDATSFGNSYQWGRATDGHQIRTSDTRTTIATTPQPEHGDFILNPTGNSWFSPTNNNLWQGLDGINNPCPSGYRIPTRADWTAEIPGFMLPNSNAAIESPLRLTYVGARSKEDGTYTLIGVRGDYWTSTIDVQNRSISFSIENSGTNFPSRARASGRSVRCIKGE